MPDTLTAHRREGSPRSASPPLPAARGPITAALFAHLHGVNVNTPPLGTQVWLDDDAQLALYCCYELHYRGFADATGEPEWDPWVIDLRGRLEARFLQEVAATVGNDLPHTPASVEAWLLELASADGGPSLSGAMAERGTLDQFREFCVHRSAYQLKEADPHTWGLPRLAGEAKAAMVEIQANEYGQGVHDDMHSVLFAATMRALGLDDTYGAYLEELPAATLATCNLVSLFGLHRRWRGALVGHLALFEMTSIGPMGRYAAALERLGVEADARRFYEVHVEADAHHERIALTRMVRGLLAEQPELAFDVAFGAAALSAVEGRFARMLLAAWADGRTARLGPSNARKSA